MNQLLQRLLHFMVTGILLVLVLNACKKDPYEVGLDLLPPNDTLYVSRIDTVSIQAYAELEDSIRSDEMTSLVLGSVVDPVFGKTTASFFSQFLLSSETIDFGVNPKLDSLVLLLYYDSWYGDTSTLQQVRVYEVSEDLYYDSSYYSNQSVSHYGIELANLVYQPRPTDSIEIWGSNVAPHLRINLSNQTHYLANKILFAPSNVLTSNTEFIKFMKGLYVESEPVSSKGGLIKFTPVDGLSKIVLYFHNDNDDSLQFNMPIDASVARFNQFDHHGYQDASPDLKQQVIYGDTSLGNHQLYLQTLGGIKVRLRFPFIRSLDDSLGPIAINDAILTLTNPQADTTWGPPPQLTMYKVDSAGKIGAVVDALEGIDYFGGIYNRDKRQYWFRLTRHIQQLLINDTLTNYDLMLYASDPLVRTPATNRVILNGIDPLFISSRNNPLQLEIIYTQLD